VRIINLEAGMPLVEEARKRLIKEIDTAIKDGVSVLEIIHGYGSSGRGGKLKDAIRKSLLYRRREGRISTFIYGEKWNIFEQSTREVLGKHPYLERDRDLNNDNPGITIVLH